VTNPKKYTTQVVKYTLVLFLLAAAGWLIHLGWHTIQLFKIVPDASKLAQGGMVELDTTHATELLHQAAGHLEAIETDLRPTYPLLRFLSGMPGIGSYMGQVQPLIVLGSNLTLAAEQVVLGLEPLLAGVPDTNYSRTVLQWVSNVVKEGGSNFTSAAEFIQHAAEARNQIDPSFLPASFKSLYIKLDEIFPVIEQGVAILPNVPDLLGSSQPVNYLVLAQNRDELRASGGFISGIGNIRLNQGQIMEFEIGDSYRIDDFSKPYPAPPEPLQRLMLAGFWVPRDANWSPDFPTAARQVQALYTLSTNQDTQGVIAFDQQAIKLIVKSLGSLSIPGVPQPITALNIETYMQQAWAPDLSEGLTDEWWQRRKDFMGLLGKAILEKLLQTNDQETQRAVIFQALDLLKSGHLLVQFNQPVVQEFLARTGLDHSLQPKSSDFLMVVDTNFGFNKADAMIQRAVDYQLDLTNPSQPKALIRLRYQHTIPIQVPCEHLPTYGDGTYEDLKTRCYWDYWRVYVHNNSVLQDYTTQSVPGDQLLSGEPWSGVVESYPGENSTQVYAGVLVLPTNLSGEVKIMLALPPDLVLIDSSGNLHYSLRIQKQPGLDSLPYHIQVRLPAGYKLGTPSTGWSQTSPTTWSWADSLTENMGFDLDFLPEQ